MKLKSFALLSLALLSVVGCSGGPEGGVAVYSVSGTVKMNGAVLPEATVVFAPLEEGQQTPTGTTDSEGNFTLTTYEFNDGAPEGSYKVIVTKTLVASSGGSEELGAAGHEQAEEAASSHSKSGATDSQNLVPPKYSSADTSPLDAEVKSSGENTFNFELTP